MKTKKKQPKVSIIIPLYVIVERFFEDLEQFTKLDYPDYEILVVCDKDIKRKLPPKTKLVLTGMKRSGPAEKRDIGLASAKGEICGFIDDDAYPHPDWLKNAVANFKDKNLAAVGGPGITPPEDSFWEQVTGVVYNSYFCGGPTQHRFTKAKRMYVNDFPAYNLLVRTSVLKEVGGYGSYFYGGEDTFLCLKIIKQGWKILYDPEVVVFHHRRKLFWDYFKQIANIGKHRGYFAKKFPETSRHLTYFLPTILTIGFMVGFVLAVVNQFFAILFFILIAIFYLLAVASVIRKTNIIYASLAGIGVILTHVFYGVSFVDGLLTKHLER